MRFALYIYMWMALTPAYAAQDPSLCVRFLSANSGAIQELDEQIESKIKKRTAQINSATPVLLRDDDGAPTSLVTGFKKLFTRDIMLLDINSARSRFAQLAEAWINHHRNLMRKNIESKLRESTIETMRLNILKLKDLKSKQISELSRSVSEKILDEYSSGLRSEPNFQELRDLLTAKYNELLTELNAEYPLDDKSIDKNLITILKKDLFQEAIIKNSKNKIQMDITANQAVAIYEPSIGTLALQLNEKSQKSMSTEQAFQAIYLHGSGTNKSNVASWATLIPLLAQNGTEPFAFDMPGSIGETGIAMNPLRLSQEVGLYINRLVKYTRETREPNVRLPVIAVGRSAGSTQGLMSALMNHVNHLLTGPDLYFLTSYSDPCTIEQQDLCIQEQLKSGNIKGILPDALKHFDTTAKGFQHHLETIKNKNPELLVGFGDNVVFAQGEADEDGQLNDGSHMSVFDHIRSYRDRYAPYAHVYELHDPLKKYRGRGLIDHFKNDSLETTHFLYSNRPNVTNENRGEFPTSIPDIDLPKLRDQSYEVFALKYAMMDYFIDLSPVTSNSKKTELREQRQKLTGSTEPFSYLDWFIKEKLITKMPELEGLTLQNLINNQQIDASRTSGVPGRVKKVYLWILDEAKRIQNLRNANQPAA